MKTNRLTLMLVIVTALVLSACGGEGDGEPTLSVEQIQTFAVMTYQAQLTQTALAQPSATPTPSQTPVPVVTFSLPEGSPAATNTVAASGGQPAACYGLAFVKDVTIPDGTKMTPGQSFTKTWLVTNSGSCAWEPGFVWNVVGGEVMSGASVTLNQRVEPGRQHEFSVSMVAPTNKTGELEGDWRLSDANGNFFGETPWVKIVVGGATASATATATTGSYPNP